MGDIKSFVRRNSRLTSSQKKHLKDENVFLIEDGLSNILKVKPHVGLEIGFGMGDSLLDVADKHPEQFWVGVEVYHAGVASVIGQAKANDLQNIALCIGDIFEILEHQIPDNSLNHVRIFFPDPWPKKKHLKRRLIQAPFLAVLARAMKPGGLLHIATDNAEYAQSCIELLQESTLYELSNIQPFRPMTKFARKAIEKNVKITDIVGVRS